MKINNIYKVSKLYTLILLLLVSIFLSSCNSFAKNQAKSETSTSETTTIDHNDAEITHILVSNIPIHEEPKYNGVYIKKTFDEFNAFGFEYGDSVDIVFSNGYELTDIPYFSGFYTAVGDPLLVAYPGYEYIDACIYNGDGLWSVGNFEPNDTATISLHEKGKYLSRETLLKVKYTDDRNDYASDEIFANFRNVKTGNLKKDILYRGASPIDNQHNRARYADELIEKSHVKYDVNLSDTVKDITDHFNSDDFDSDYFKSLYEEGRVSITPLTMNYKSEEFAKMIVKAMTDMSRNEGPYYIHCLEGKDRTGFLCMIIEGLTGASYEEIIKDYMASYDNYYQVNENNNKEKYDAIKENNINAMLRFLADNDPNAGNGDIELEDLDWVNITGRYLERNGMTEEDINNFYIRLTDENYHDPD